MCNQRGLNPYRRVTFETRSRKFANFHPHAAATKKKSSKSSKSVAVAKTGWSTRCLIIASSQMSASDVKICTKDSKTIPWQIIFEIIPPGCAQAETRASQHAAFNAERRAGDKPAGPNFDVALCAPRWKPDKIMVIRVMILLKHTKRPALIEMTGQINVIARAAQTHTRSLARAKRESN